MSDLRRMFGGMGSSDSGEKPIKNRGSLDGFRSLGKCIKIKMMI
jgi:hypothetical protein